jgi:anti-anti-sigma regulatory factor
MSDFVVNEMEGSTGIKLPAVLDFSAAEQFLQTARQVAGKPCEIDASAVARFSTPCAQVLIALLRDGEANVVVRPSDAFCEALAELGLTDEIAPRMK